MTSKSLGSISPRAGFWRRLLGAFIDELVLVICGTLLHAALHSLGDGLSVILVLTYFTVFVGSTRGQTPGMAAVGVNVVSSDGSGSIGYARALIRTIGGFISAAPYALGFLWMLWDKDKQCWHDKFASAFVVRT